MQFVYCLTILLTIGAVFGQDFARNASEIDGIAEAPRAPRDKFRIIQSNINEDRLNDEIEDFIAYGCEKMVVLTNKAHSEVRLSCRSHHDAPKSTILQPGNSYMFSFRPQKKGNSKFWCTIEYKQQFARFDVYNEQHSYMCPRDVDELHRYIIHHDGVYVKGAKGGDDKKIRALFKGHNQFILWEEFENNHTDGFLTSGFVDGGMCSDVPDQFNDKTAAVTICYNHCVHLYEHFGCRGIVQTVQANDECIDVGLNEELGGKLSAVQGC